jgi:hypothetical protein
VLKFTAVKDRDYTLRLKLKNTDSFYYRSFSCGLFAEDSTGISAYLADGAIWTCMKSGTYY